MRNFGRFLMFFLVIAALTLFYASKNRSAVRTPIPGVAQRLDSSIFNGNYTQYTDQFGNAARAAFDVSGRRIGVQVGKCSHEAPNGMVVEMTYLEPDADHPLGQAFDAAGNPKPLNTGLVVNQIQA